MNCFIHEDRVAVATCVSCGKGMCAECASFFDTPDGTSYGCCPVCRKGDLASEKANLERVRNDLWIKAVVEKKKAKNKALTALMFGVLLTAVVLALEFAFDISLLALIGVPLVFDIPFIDGVSISLNTLVSLVPILICAVIFAAIRSKANKRFYDMNLQASAYERSRFALGKSLETIDAALVKNRSNIRTL
ncbi:MAG: hypothetical protein LBQ40_06955 [Clostridiales bacterium]|jgi:hypothetical protein|nr:hypothetical protein [Clostridiales bacterium]